MFILFGCLRRGQEMGEAMERKRNNGKDERNAEWIILITTRLFVPVAKRITVTKLYCYIVIHNISWLLDLSSRPRNQLKCCFVYGWYALDLLRRGRKYLCKLCRENWNKSNGWCWLPDQVTLWTRFVFWRSRQMRWEELIACGRCWLSSAGSGGGLEVRTLAVAAALTRFAQLFTPRSSELLPALHYL